jgi:hypothetical protein
MSRALRAAAACALLLLPSCATRQSADTTAAARSFAGMPVYPNISQTGSVDGRLAVFSSPDEFGRVADWYHVHMPRSARFARDNTTSQATWAIFSSRETKTVHVEIVDGTVRITLADVAIVPAAVPTAR